MLKRFHVKGNEEEEDEVEVPLRDSTVFGTKIYGSAL